MHIYRTFTLLILPIILTGCGGAKLDEKLEAELVDANSLPYPTKYLYPTKKKYDDGYAKYGRDAYKDLTDLVNEMLDTQQIAKANAYLELMKEMRLSSGFTKVGEQYPHVVLKKKADSLALGLELETAFQFALQGDIAAAEQIVNWCCDFSESEDQAHPHHEQVEEILKALAPHVAMTFLDNPQQWKSDERIKHIIKNYAPYFNPKDLKAVKARFLEWATKDILLIKDYISNQQYLLAQEKAEYLNDVYAEMIILDSEISLPVINARARKYHELLASRPEISVWTKLAHERIAWFFFKGNYVSMPEYKVHGENKLKIKTVSKLDDYCFPYKNRDWEFYLLDNKEAEVTIDLYDCKFAGIKNSYSYQKRGMVTKTRWETYEEKVPVYESITTYEEHKTTSYKLDMGQTTKCLTTKNNRCTSTYRTTADPVVVPESTYLIPKTENTLVGYKTVTRRRAINYQEPGLTTRSGGAHWSAITGKVHMTYQGAYSYKAIYVDKDFIVGELHSAFRDLANEFDLKASINFDHQNAYQYRYDELLEILLETKDLPLRESLTAQLFYLYSLIDSKPTVKPKSENIFKDKYGIGLEMAGALDPKMKEPEPSKIKGTRLLYDKSAEQYTPHKFEKVKVIAPKSHYLMKRISENRVFWSVCDGPYWPPGKEVGEAEAKICYNKSPNYWDKRAKELKSEEIKQY